MEAVAAMDLSALSRRELQALCKLNGVRANMTNLAMAEALQSLPSVDGIDRIGTTLCLPTPGKSAMKPALRAEDHHQQQQQGSPLPRGRRVSVKSPEAIRMDVEGGEDETRWGPAKEIVRTPGVALRSRPLATPVQTPAAGTLRRSQRSTARKAAAPVEAEVAATARRSTRKTAKMNMAIDFDQEEEEEKVQAVEPKGAASDVKCDDPEEEEKVTKLLGGNSEADEPEQGEEVISSVAPIESADKSSGDKVVEEVVEEATKPREGATIVEEQKSVFEDSPIFGVLSKVAPEPVMKNVENASTEDVEGFGNWSPVLEIANEINSASEDQEVAAVEVPKEAVKEDAFRLTVEAADAPNKIILADVTEKEVAVDEVPLADPTDDDSGEEYDLNGESSDEADLAEESSEDDDIDEDEDMQKGGLTVDGDSDEVDLTVESSDEDEDMQSAGLTGDGDSDETIEASNSTEVNFDSDEEEEELNMLETGEEMKEDEDSNSLTEGEDDFSGDLSSEFDSDFSDAETESNSSPVALESFHAAAPSSAAKSAESSITEETIVKSLDKVTITEKKEECAKEKKPLKVGEGMSLRKLKCAYKESLVAAKEGKKLTIDANEGTRVALAELDDNAEC